VSTFVSVGNAKQPFLRLLNAVVDNLSVLPAPVLMQTGAAAGFNAEGCRCIDFMAMEAFATQIHSADLVILHGGAGSLLHAVSAGKVPVVMPRLAAYQEHIDDHQVEFTHELEQLGKIVVCQDSAQLAEAAQQALQKQALLATRQQATSEVPMVGLIRQLLQQHAVELQQ
jgi:UDP-N-acetylglucosamine transferase subunit ALG13